MSKPYNLLIRKMIKDYIRYYKTNTILDDKLIIGEFMGFPDVEK